MTAVAATVDDIGNIWYTERTSIFRYYLDTQSAVKIVSTSSLGSSSVYLTDTRQSYGQLVFRHGCLVKLGAGKLVSYDISKNTLTTLCSASYGYAGIYDSNMYYIFTSSSLSSTYYNRFYNFETNKYNDQIKTNNPFSSSVYSTSYPVYVFDTKPYKIAGCIRKTSLTGMTLNRKEYDFDKNTAIIYSTTNNTGKYRTQLFKNDTVLNNGRILIGFDDVDLFEKGETENTLHTTIPTHYGDTTKWVQIK